jgi:hypothetical protein
MPNPIRLYLVIYLKYFAFSLSDLPTKAFSITLAS